MTNREFFNAIITGTVVLNAGKNDETSYPAYENGEVIEELKEFATAAIKKLDDKNAAAKKKTGPSKVREANLAIAENLYPQLEDNRLYTAKELGEILEENTSKGTVIAKLLCEQGRMECIQGKGKEPKNYRKISV